ncbi:DedA family protein [Candidatus Woesearchaeota archaeon]|nr:DedA family protein [Candidatus Woesearchaeota archaeon]
MNIAQNIHHHSRRIVSKAHQNTKNAVVRTVQGTKMIVIKGEEIVIEYGEKIIQATRNERFRRNFKLLTTILVISIIILFSYVLFRYRTFEAEIQEFIQNYGYGGIMVVSFILDTLIIPLAPDIALIFGILGGLPWYSVLAAVLIGSTIASFTGYYLGILYGKHGLIRMYGTVKYLKWSSQFEQHGKWLMVLGATTPVPYVPMLGGVFNLTLKEFILYAIVPRTLRYLMVALFFVGVF